jgi:hypothetical protein
VVGIAGIMLSIAAVLYSPLKALRRLPDPIPWLRHAAISPATLPAD